MNIFLVYKYLLILCGTWLVTTQPTTHYDYEPLNDSFTNVIWLNLFSRMWIYLSIFYAGHDFLPLKQRPIMITNHLTTHSGMWFDLMCSNACVYISLYSMRDMTHHPHPPTHYDSESPTDSFTKVIPLDLFRRTCISLSRWYVGHDSLPLTQRPITNHPTSHLEMWYILCMNVVYCMRDMTHYHSPNDSLWTTQRLT